MDSSNPIVSLLILGALSLVPLVFMVSTSFVKLSVVFSILRNALGAGQVPSGTVVAALAAVLSIYVMAPVGRQMLARSGPLVEQLDAGLSKSKGEALLSALGEVTTPLSDFLRRNSGARPMKLFTRLSVRSGMTAPDGEPGLTVRLPAFLVTELTEAFQVGFLVFLPFLIIDMVISNVLLALGMHMLSPTTISLPFKLLLFVVVDGWYLLSEALVMGYR